MRTSVFKYSEINTALIVSIHSDEMFVKVLPSWTLWVIIKGTNWSALGNRFKNSFRARNCLKLWWLLRYNYGQILRYKSNYDVNINRYTVNTESFTIFLYASFVNSHWGTVPRSFHHENGTWIKCKCLPYAAKYQKKTISYFESNCNIDYHSAFKI